MIWLLGAATALAVLLVVPAIPNLAHAVSARRAAMLAQHAADRQRREDEAAERRRQVERIWHETPDLGVMREYTRFEAQVRQPLQQAADEAGRRRDQVDQSIGRLENGFRNHQQPRTTYQVLVLFFLVVFLCVFGLGMALDYMIFRSLHPGGLGALLLSAGLAAIAMIGITVGSILAFGARHHELLPESMTDYSHRVVRLFGVMLAVGIAAYMALIAPNRSELNWAPVITADNQALQLAEFNVKTAPNESAAQGFKTAQQAAQTQLTNDTNALNRAKTVDRWSAIALGALEIPLAELAVLGTEVLILRILLVRLERARRDKQDADDDVQRADNQFMAQLVVLLTGYGLDEETVREGLVHVRQLGVILGTAFGPPGAIPGGGPGPGGTPGAGHGPGQGSPPPSGANGHGGPAGAQPGTGAPTGTAQQPGTTHPWPPTVPMQGGGTPSNPVPPPIIGNVIPPTQPQHASSSNNTPRTVPGTVVGPSPATIARLPQDELDETA